MGTCVHVVFILCFYKLFLKLQVIPLFKQRQLALACFPIRDPYNQSCVVHTTDSVV